MQTYSHTSEYTGDYNELIYLRARFYASGVGRFLTRDTWSGNDNFPLSFNRWNYVQSNPINFIDPSGNRILCPWGWNQWAVNWRVDEAEKYVSQTSDPIDTYVAAGIAIQCAGVDNYFNHNSGVGIAQITLNQAATAWGEPIYEYDIQGNKIPEKDEYGNPKKDKNGNIIYKIRSYGLGCPDGQLEKLLNPYDNDDAVILMKREIQLVTNECKDCTSTDIYIAAALAQNGPGFTYKDMRNGVDVLKPKDRIGMYQHITRDWEDWFISGQPKNNQVQLGRFNLVIKELMSRRWIVPYLDWNILKYLPNV